MRSHSMMQWLRGALCSLLLTVSVGCKSTPDRPAVLHDSNIPLAEIYDKSGTRIVGYQGYADGFVTNTLKACNAMMDKAGVH